MNVMRRRLGGSGLALTELGFGGAPLGNLFRAVTDHEAAATLASAREAGLGYFDTAPFYGFGLSEKRLGDALRDSDSIVSSKVGRLLEPVAHAVSESDLRHGYATAMPFEPVFDYSYDAVMRSWRESLQRLGLPRIDILYIHDIGSMTHGVDHARRMEQLVDGGGLAALEKLRADGAVSAIGVGVNEVAVCLEVMAHVHLDVILLAGRYTLLEQSPLEDLFPRCLETGTRIVVGGPFNSGILVSGVGKDTAPVFNYGPASAMVIEKVAAMEAVCSHHGVPLPAAAIQFPLAHALVASVVPGMASPRQVEQALTFYRHPIPAALWRDLWAEGLLHQAAPVPA